MSSNRKIVIIGAGGRLGASLARNYGAAGWEVIPLLRRDWDVMDLDRIGPVLGKREFQVLVFTAGTTDVDLCETNPAMAEATNTAAPAALARFCARRGARFIHISTDYVFKGDEPAPRKETDPADPINVYGRTKLEGERAVLEVSPDFLVVRVSWLFGPDRPSFPDRILARAMESDRVEAVADKHSCPTYSEDFARWLEPLLGETGTGGLLHLCNHGSTSWQGYGQAVLDLAAKIGFPLRARKVDPISRVGFPGFKALRPEFTAFDTGKFEQLTGIKPRPWQEAIEEYLRKKYAAR